MIAALVVLGQLTLGTDSHLTYSYDKFKDESEVSMPPEGLALDGCSLKLQIVAFGEGAALRRPSSFIDLISQSKDWKYLYTHEVHWLVDGKRVEVGQSKHDGRVGEGFVLEFLTIDLSLGMLRRLAHASSVEFEVGSDECKFTSEDLAAAAEVWSVISKADAQAKPGKRGK